MNYKLPTQFKLMFILALILFLGGAVVHSDLNSAVGAIILVILSISVEILEAISDLKDKIK